MQSVSFWTGVILTLAVSFCLIAWGIAELMATLEELRERRRRRFLAEARQEWGHRILKDAYWLSENVDAHCTMEAIGNALAGDYPDMWVFRNTLWNKIEKTKEERAARATEQ